MKIIQINSVYNKGSTGKIVFDIHNDLLKNNIDSIICYGRGKKSNDENVIKVCSEVYSYIQHFISEFTGIPYNGFFFSTRKIINIIKKEKPDIVHIHCLNGYYVNIYKLIKWLKINRISTILTLHAEFMYTGGCGLALDCNKWLEARGCHNCIRFKQEFHSKFFDRTNFMWNQMIRAFEGFDKKKLIVSSVSPWLLHRAKQSYVFKDYRNVTVENGLDTNVFHAYDSETIDSLKNKHKIRDEKVIFYVTPTFNIKPNHNKGANYVIELAKKMITEKVVFIVVGSYDKNIEVPPNITMLGNIFDQKLLAKYYSMADITLLTSKKETFSMVTAESLSCGTPVVGFKAGAPEMIAIKEYSCFVDYGNIDALYDAVIEMLSQNKKNFIIHKFAKKEMTKKYLELYHDLL
ncbi:glycosyltransferase [Absiella sp. AM29-15]|uniref:glycosyltransferase n=1 Tax=Absiella sp. AM29-15 TaxID=2292278 RepID=UPI000E427D62|nr:glycosyltransferase [Absiella sp. AM29-15]RGC45099.1 glycosyltransferase [Absiella sp. AM29-15]